MENLYQLHEDFLKSWPIERIEKMTLQEYSNLNKSDSFCYWLEAKTQDLGSIWGGSAFKFGIYEKNQKQKSYQESGRLSDQDYAWMSKYGTTREIAFSKIKDLILKVIFAAHKNDLKTIDEVDLGEAYKWKIAFLYSDFRILNVFKKAKLQEIASSLHLGLDNKASFGKLQNEILKSKDENKDYFEFGKEVWDLVGTTKKKLYWLYSPGEQAYKWESFYHEGVMAIGWDTLGDLTQYNSREELRNALVDAYGGEGSKKNDVTANDDFLNNMNIGDIVIVKKRLKTLLGYGEITSDYYFDDEQEDYKHRRKVKWLKSGNWNIENDSLVLKTLTDITQYISPLDKSVPYYQYLLDLINSNNGQNSSYQNPMKNLLHYKKQIILQGPPGTGKTREAKLLAKEMLGLNSVKELLRNEQFKLVQFHASYSYEDFVRGIVAKPNPDGEGILYEAENKILGKFAKEALENYQMASNPQSRNDEKSKFEKFKNYIIEKLDVDEKFTLSEKVYIFYVDEKRFKYKGDNWTAHPNGLNMNFDQIAAILDLGLSTRQDINKCEQLNALTRQHATYYQIFVEKFQEYVKDNPIAQEDVVLKNYVLVIDEINRANLSSVLGELIYALEYRGEAVESMYDVDGTKELILPPNLYIIGTMNTADRSVGHIDYAIRRRFAFVDVLPKDLSEESGVRFDLTLFNQVTELFSNHVSPEFNVKDVALGHSYFIQKKEKNDKGEEVLNPSDFNIRLEYEIKPILREYVKDGVLIGEDIHQKIENLKASI